MNKIQPLDQVRSIVASALNQATKVRKNFQDFFIETMLLILTICGKLNFCAIVKCKSLKRKIKVVIAEFKCAAKTVGKILFSTELTLKATEIFLICHSRFQIEFLFRDAKQNTGLNDWQSSDADRLSFGYNASLSAVNVARQIADEIQEQTGRRLSVASVRKVLHNAAPYQHIRKSVEGRESDNPQNKQVLSDDIPPDLLFFGVRDSA